MEGSSKRIAATTITQDDVVAWLAEDDVRAADTILCTKNAVDPLFWNNFEALNREEPRFLQMLARGEVSPRLVVPAAFNEDGKDSSLWCWVACDGSDAMFEAMLSHPSLDINACIGKKFARPVIFYGVGVKRLLVLLRDPRTNVNVYIPWEANVPHCNSVVESVLLEDGAAELMEVLCARSDYRATRYDLEMAYTEETRVGEYGRFYGLRADVPLSWIAHFYCDTPFLAEITMQRRLLWVSKWMPRLGAPLLSPDMWRLIGLYWVAMHQCPRDMFPALSALLGGPVWAVLWMGGRYTAEGEAQRRAWKLRNLELMQERKIHSPK